MDKALAEAIRAAASSTGPKSIAAKERKRYRPGKSKGSGSRRPPKPKPDETQIQVAINARPDDWSRFKAQAAEEYRRRQNSVAPLRE